MDEEAKYQRELNELRREHEELNGRIERWGKRENVDQIRLQRMKKRKLWLRDRISLVEKYLYPDIIA